VDPIKSVTAGIGEERFNAIEDHYIEKQIAAI
jgi:hypothetical protein